MTLEHVGVFIVPRTLVSQTLRPLQAAGRRGHEAFVLWGGRVQGSTAFRFEQAYMPRQTATRSERGLLVVVEGAELFRANRDFYRLGLTLAGQVHSHPTDAYHSATDDEYPLITLRGGVSAVVPDFARGGEGRLGEWAWYRLVGTADWAPIAAESTIRVVE
jgi:hypothetical protein